MNKLPKQVYTKAFCDNAVKLVVGRFRYAVIVARVTAGWVLTRR